jgi:hypothetical protein
MTESTDDTFNRFVNHWQQRDPTFQLDQDKVREQIVMVLAAAMSILATSSPEVMDEFIDGCSDVAKRCVPLEIQRAIKEKVG